MGKMPVAHYRRAGMDVTELAGRARAIAQVHPPRSIERVLLHQCADALEAQRDGSFTVEDVEARLGLKADGTQRRLAPWQVEALGGRSV